MGWSRDAHECKSCGRSDLKHHANGLCRSCYTRDRANRVGRWPSWLNACIMCGIDKEGTNYRSAGLCKRCHKIASRAGVLVFWRTEVKIRRNDSDCDASVIMKEIAMMVGVTTACERFDLSAEAFRAYAKGEKPVPEEIRDRAFALWLGV